MKPDYITKQVLSVYNLIKFSAFFLVNEIGIKENATLMSEFSSFHFEENKVFMLVGFYQVVYKVLLSGISLSIPI